MAKVNKGRFTAEIEGEFVVFLIGMTINKPWKIHKWLPMFLAMPRMLRELSTDPDSGFLGYMMPPIPTVIVQYWRSFEHLEAYARSKDGQHWPAWVAFNKNVRASSGDVGIWHETYRVPAGAYETIYGGAPALGLGKATKLVPVSAHRESARQRIEHQDTAGQDGAAGNSAESASLSPVGTGG
jgi:hypothetical protein